MEINSFIKQARAVGRSDEQIRQFLISRGFNQLEVDGALWIHADANSPQPLPRTIGLPEVPHQHANQPHVVTQQTAPEPEFFPAPDLSDPYRPPTDTSQPQPKQDVPQQAQVRAPERPVKPKKKRKLKLKKVPVIVSLVLLVVGGAGAAYLLPKQGAAQSNNEAVQKFIDAMQHQDKEAADALMSDNAKAFFQQKTGTQSAYESCLRSGSVCAPLFKADFLEKAQRTEKEYESGTGGGKGIETTFLLTTKHIPSANCKDESISMMTIAAVPQDGKWMIDKVTPQFDTSSIVCAKAP